MIAGVLWWLGVIAAGVVLLTAAVVLRGAPYVPSRRHDVARAFDDLYVLGADDVLVDIGSGDGVVLRMAAERGARAVGVELNPLLVWLSRWLSRRYSGVSVVLADMWRYELPPGATVVYVFGTGRDVPRIAAWVEAQVARRSRPLYVMSYGFELPWPAGRSVGAHHLYHVMPLQHAQPQV